MSLSGKSRVYGIFGDPVAHSLSPLMQNRAFAAAGIDAVYVPFHVRPARLAEAVAAIRTLQLGGVNVTLPHKERVLPLLDEVDRDAQMIGAVNTIVHRNGRLVGYNTDGSGFVRSLQEDLDFSPQGSRVLLLGAGGACRAAVVALARAGAASIGIANRTLERAEQLTAELSAVLPGVELLPLALQGDGFLGRLQEAELVVNTTSVGLKGEGLAFCPLEQIKPSARLYDMVYSTAATPLLQRAAGLGLRAADGLGMLAAQGEEAFWLWTGIRPESGLMKRCLMQKRTEDQSLREG